MNNSLIEFLNNFLKESSSSKKKMILEALLNELKELLRIESILIVYCESNSLCISSKWFTNKEIESKLYKNEIKTHENHDDEFNRIRENFIKETQNKGEIINEELILHYKNKKLTLLSSSSNIEESLIMKEKIKEQNSYLKSLFRILNNKNEAIAELEHHKSIINSLNEGICSLDQEGTIIWMNDAFEKMSGYKREELLGKPGLLLHHPIDHPKLKETLRKRAAGSERHSSYHMHILRKDGSIKDVFVSGVIVRSVTGEPTGSCGIFMDISGFTKLESEIKETKDFLEILLETMSEGVMTFKIDGQIQYINLASRKMLGLESKSFNEPNSFYEIIASPNDYNEEFFYRLLKKLLHHDREMMILRMKKADGTEIPVQITFTIAVDVVKEVKFIVGIMRDLSKGFELIEQVKSFRRHLFQISNATLSIIRFGITGTEIVYSDPLYFTDDNAVLLQSAAIYLSALGQTKMENGIQVWSQGTFGPLPVPKHSTEELMIYFGSMASDERSDDRFSENEQNEPFLIILIFPKSAETIFHKEEIHKAITETLEEKNITSFSEFNQKRFIGKLKERIIESEVGIKSLVNQDTTLQSFD